MQTKSCNVCGESKPMDAFFPSQRLPGGKRRADGRRAVCKACCRAKRRKWLEEMPDAKRDRLRDKRNRYSRAWDKRNPHAVKASKANLHAKRVGAVGRVSAKDVESAWLRYDGKCWVCGFPSTEIDHYRPINCKGGGTNTADNILPICRECNQKRSHRWHGEVIAMKEAEMLKGLKELLNEAEGQ